MTKIGAPRTAVKPSDRTSPDDLAIIGDLLETIERNPGSVEARRLLVQQYEMFGWMDAAADVTREILFLLPGDTVASAWLVAHLHRGDDTQGLAHPNSERGHDIAAKSTVFSSTTATLGNLESGYNSLMEDAEFVLQELLAFQELCPSRPDLNFSGQISDLRAIAEGRLTSAIRIRPPPAARLVATQIQSGAEVGFVFSDLEANARWIRKKGDHEDPDKVRDAVRRRADTIIAALPKEFVHIVETAFMHVEHEVLGRCYHNEDSITMYGDAISSVPRESFWVSEDGYAWDMTELAEAIKANKGVMRNPLSKQMFTLDDVRAIVRHPLGQQLAALHLKQQQLTEGVRLDTVKRLEKMANILLGDQSDNAAPSRHAVDEFLTYTATLPNSEQDALNDLKVPARDSHTGQNFDVSIGEAVADAKANRQCFHKTGDHLRQAASYLRERST